MAKPIYTQDFSRQLNSILTRLSDLELANYKPEIQWHTIGDTGEPILTNNWAAYGGLGNVAEFCIDKLGFVHLRGNVKDGTVASGTPIFNLPEGYRPVKNNSFNVIAGTGTGVLTVEPDGDVCLISGSNVVVVMDGITFSTN